MCHGRKLVAKAQGRRPRAHHIAAFRACCGRRARGRRGSAGRARGARGIEQHLKRPRDPPTCRLAPTTRVRRRLAEGVRSAAGLRHTLPLAAPAARARRVLRALACWRAEEGACCGLIIPPSQRVMRARVLGLVRVDPAPDTRPAPPSPGACQRRHPPWSWCRAHLDHVPVWIKFRSSRGSRIRVIIRCLRPMPVLQTANTVLYDRSHSFGVGAAELPPKSGSTKHRRLFHASSTSMGRRATIDAIANGAHAQL